MNLRDQFNSRTEPTRPDEGRQSPGPAEEGSGPDAWVDRHGDALYRWALQRLGRHDAAADVVQETFLAALDRRWHFDGHSSERTWLIGILKHKISDYLRRERRDRPSDGSTAEHAGGDRLSAAFDPRGFWSRGPRHWGDPGRALESAEFWETFRDCLGALPKHLSETFLLRELEGVDGPEVCRSLGISSESFWKRMHRARLLLRDCLERRWFERI